MAGVHPRDSDRLDRRTFLTDLGRASLAVVVLGACSTDPETVARVTSVGASSTDGAAATTASPTTGDVAPSTTGAADQTGTTEATASDAWERIDLRIVSAFVVVRAGEAVLVDTGQEGSSAAILQALEGLGVGWADLATVFVTHGHPDHDGSLRAVTHQAPNARVYAGAEDIPSMDSETEITAVEDGQVIAGMQVVTTPGHTPGHISILDPDAGWLLAGDALNGADGAIIGPNPQFSQDMDQAIESVRKLGGLEFDAAGFGHGGPITGGARTQLDALIATL